jgi:arabinogalactan oligomer/maltooligosaccharide transport system permease protein
VNLAERLKQSALAGLVAGAAFVLVASMWLQGGVESDVANQHRQRQAVLLANAVGASLAAAPDAEANARVRAWKTQFLSIESVRVAVGRELVASTRAEDEAPRSLRMEERPLFDLANALRAAAETNRAEGVVRKKTLQVDDRGRDAVTVTVPLVRNGQVEGVVQVQFVSAADAAAPGGPSWGLALLLLAAAAAAGALLRVAPERRFDLARAAAVVLLVVLAWVYQQQGARHLQERFARTDLMVAELQRDAASLHVRSGAPAVREADAPSAWDTDGYGRPLGRVSHEGRVLAHEGVPPTEAVAVFLQRSMWVIDALGVLVLLGFLQGYAARAAAALRKHAAAYAYVAPAMIGMLVLVFFPFLYGMVLAFTDTTLFNEYLPLRERWIGFANFGAILGDFNVVQRGVDGLIWNFQNFYWTLMVNVIWTVTNVSIGVSVGFLLALALNTDGLLGKPVYRVLLILPWAIPNYITALIWRGMFHPQFGVINQVLQMVGLEPVKWFDGVVSSFLTGLATNGWLSFPFMMVVILGALQSIPKDMYEAAEVEGATRWQQLVRITLPLLRPTLVPAIVISVVWTFNMFNIIFLVSNGEPAGANEILVTKAYKIAFEQYQYAYAAAYSTVIFLILLVYGYFQTRLTRATESY